MAGCRQRFHRRIRRDRQHAAPHHAVPCRAYDNRAPRYYALDVASCYDSEVTFEIVSYHVLVVRQYTAVQRVLLDCSDCCYNEYEEDTDALFDALSNSGTSMWPRLRFISVDSENRADSCVSATNAGTAPPACCMRSEPGSRRSPATEEVVFDVYGCGRRRSWCAYCFLRLRCRLLLLAFFRNLLWPVS